MNKAIWHLGLFIIFRQVNAQYLVYTQNYASPMNLNTTLTGTAHTIVLLGNIATNGIVCQEIIFLQMLLMTKK
jgi:hypothetical protein